jgi:hypothetical protein
LIQSGRFFDLVLLIPGGGYIMKVLSICILLLFLSASFCAGPKSKEPPKLIIVEIDYARPDTNTFLSSEANVKSGDTLMFSASMLEKESTVLIPMGDLVFHLDSGDLEYEVAGIKYVFVPLLKKTNNFMSRKFIIKTHKKRTEYDYSVYIHKKKKMAEQKSSPKIIVDP